MSKVPRQPRVNISLSIQELIGLCMMLKGGKMFASPKVWRDVQTVLSRVDKRLVALGLPREVIDKLVKL